jgi:hypothetical protein
MPIIPVVNINEINGNIGSVDVSRKPLCVLGPAGFGTGVVLQPEAFTQNSDFYAKHSEGHLSDCGLAALKYSGNSIVAVRSAATTAGTNGAVVASNGTGAVQGTSVVTITGTPYSDYEHVLLVVTGGTRGTAGIQFQLSSDGGRNWGAVTDLGTAVTVTIPGSNNAWAIAAGTLVAGDKFTATTIGAVSTAADVTAALNVLLASSIDFEIIDIATPMTAAIYALMDPWVNTMRAQGRPVSWIGHCRRPLTTENASTYRTAMDAIFGSLSSEHCLGITYGDVFDTNLINGRQYSHMVNGYGGALAMLKPHQDAADQDLTQTLPGYQLKDSTGQYVKHNELVTPGPTAARYVTLENGEKGVGVYFTSPVMHSSVGSDFRFAQHRRVMNVCEFASRAFFRKKLNEGVVVDKKTGRIRNEVADNIEREADAFVRAAVYADPMVSYVEHAVSRTDDILRTDRLGVKLGVIPLGYLKQIDLDASFQAKATV